MIRTVTLITNYDEETGTYMAMYREYPQAFAMGLTIEEAEARLIDVIKVMVAERGDVYQDTLKTKI